MRLLRTFGIALIGVATATGCNAILGIGEPFIVADGGTDGGTDAAPADGATDAMVAACPDASALPCTVDTLATGLVKGYGVTANANKVFWSTLEGAGTIWSAPFFQPGSVLVNTTQPTWLAIDGPNIYWANISQIRTTPASGGADNGAYQSGGTIDGFTLDPSYFYLTSASTGIISRAPRDGGPQTTLFQDSAAATVLGIAIDATYFYWAAETQGEIRRLPLGTDGGQTPEVVAKNQQGPTGVATDGVHLFWSNYFTGDIQSLPIAGGTPKAIATGQPHPIQVSVIGDYVYWTSNGDDDAGNGTVCRFPRCCAP